GLYLQENALTGTLPTELGKLTQLKERQFQSTIQIAPRRGVVYDRNGRELAVSIPVQSVFADPKIIKNRQKVAKQLSQVLGLSKEVIQNKLKDQDKRFVWLQRRISEDSASQIKKMAIYGVGFVEEWKRIYPNETLLSQTLGFVNSEDKGIAGLELSHDGTLRGDEKNIRIKRDARGRPIASESFLFTEPPEGQHLTLTVDSEIQFAVESELSQVVQNFQAESATAIVLDAETSAIRAMGSFPTFDPNSKSNAKPEFMRNRNVTDSFEPGSVMKTFVIAKGLKEGTLDPEKKYFCENGVMKIGKRTIREADEKHDFKYLSVAEILALSSNIGTTKIAFELGEAKVREGYAEFGFGQRTKIDFPGESKGILHSLPWGDHLLSNNSFGHGMTASPLQVANAYAAIVNGGILNKPYLIERQKGDKEDGSRRVLTPEQSAVMRHMLIGATQLGKTGVLAQIDGFDVGGKTGTAQKVSSHSKGYIPGGYISSFAGFFPAVNPKYVIYIVVDYPKKAYYGSQVAAPVFSRLASYLARKDSLAPEKVSKALALKSSSIKKDLNEIGNDEKIENRATATSFRSALRILQQEEELREANRSNLKVDSEQSTYQ
ncbi:MAG: peptidoglycan D,D-transpeptidase FtsI family protein, partial [Pseudobdellovibrionaceae bacterium]